MPDAEQIALEAAREIDAELAAIGSSNRTRARAIMQTGITKAIRRHAFELAVELSQDAAELAKRFRNA